jgi:hypothetical protein
LHLHGITDVTAATPKALGELLHNHQKPVQQFGTMKSNFILAAAKSTRRQKPNFMAETAVGLAVVFFERSVRYSHLLQWPNKA